MSQVSFDFNGCNFVVTGASSGMGKQVAIELANAGAKVLALARGQKALEELQNISPENIEYAAVDVCDASRLTEIISSFVCKYGKISGAVHAAGITGLTPLRAFDNEEAHRIIDISFWGAVNLMQICTKAKISNKEASFLLFSSVRSHRTDKGLFSYASAKAALQVAAKTFAKETSNRGIRVNTISPGLVKTAMTNGLEQTHNLNEVNQSSLLGIGEASDVSGMVLFLLSDRAKWITGTDIVVDGGYLA